VIDGATITSFESSSTNGGTVTSNNDGTFDYTPATGFVGTDTFDYTICDDDTPTASCSTATVTITVTDEGNPTAVDNTASTTEDTLVTTVNVLTNDTVIDGATITSFESSS
ncbi:Ig-like domain-containing protein, partial [Thalassobellus citreus]|uniref:Ig-like domain-containing protein n=1 Tax=Thalassobellus citreus TaxID=3367752 RepID=UPI00379BDA1B